jgi:hypothetical protein
VVSAAPDAALNYRVRCQTRGAIADSVSRRRGAALDVDYDHILIRGDQYRH